MQATPKTLVPLKSRIEGVSAFGFPSFSFHALQVGSTATVYLMQLPPGNSPICILHPLHQIIGFASVAVLLALLSLSERVELMATLRPSSTFWKLAWMLVQKGTVLLARAAYLPVAEVLLMPLDCGRAVEGSGWVNDFDPSLTCWDRPLHFLNAIAGLLVVAM